MTGNIVNLSDGHSDRVAIIAAHTAVIYDKRLQKQIFMQVRASGIDLCHGSHSFVYSEITPYNRATCLSQGHCNSITCMLVSDDRSLILTSDVGNGSLLVLWNSKTGHPIQSIAQPHKFGTVAMDISPDDEWLVTVGAADPESGEQEVRLRWPWIAWLAHCMHTHE